MYSILCLTLTIFIRCCHGIELGQNFDETVKNYISLIDTANKDALINNFHKSSRESFNVTKITKSRDYGTYDFIIVGGGSAGAVLANRLSEVKEWNILLVEAGLPGNNLTDIPGMYNPVQMTTYNWGYHSTPQKTCCLGFENSQCTYPRGKGLGGSSTINGLVVTRCSQEDHNQWAAEGNSGWSWDKVFPYYLKLENAHLPNSDPSFHGHSGPFHVEYNRADAPIVPYFLEASKALGLQKLDYNGKTKYGASVTQMSTRNGRRESTEAAYLKPIRASRKNLHIITEALATKILIARKSRKAFGVDFIFKGQYNKVYARKEVILSAGAINSPQLLMLSGVGPKSDLLRHGIKPIKVLPVGRNLHDHPRTLGLFFATNFTFQVSTKEMVSQFVFNGTGLLTSPGNQAISFINSPLNPTPNNPDIEHLLAYAFVSDYYIELIIKVIGWTRETAEAVLAPYKGKWVWHMTSLLLRGKSRGTVTLASSDPLDFPLIDLNYFSDPNDNDLNTHVDAIEDIFRLSQTDALQAIGSKYEGLPLKACQNFLFQSRDYWKCFVRHVIYTTYHPGGTCKMGPKDDQTSVVNENLQVHGIKNLRVIDGSVIPNPIAGHPNIPIVMIAEKASDIIKNYYSHV